MTKDIKASIVSAQKELNVAVEIMKKALIEKLGLEGFNKISKTKLPINDTKFILKKTVPKEFDVVEEKTALVLKELEEQNSLIKEVNEYLRSGGMVN